MGVLIQSDNFQTFTYKLVIAIKMVNINYAAVKFLAQTTDDEKMHT